MDRLTFDGNFCDIAQCRELLPNDVTDMMAANGNAIYTIAEQKKALRDLRNELCQLCGKYKQAHEGACDGCRWKQ